MWKADSDRARTGDAYKSPPPAAQDAHTPTHLDTCGCAWSKDLLARCPTHNAAPDLLAACEAALAFLQRNYHGLTVPSGQLEAAITRAKGGTP